MEVLIKMLWILWICHVVQSAPRRPRLTLAESPSYFYNNIDGRGIYFIARRLSNSYDIFSMKHMLGGWKIAKAVGVHKILRGDRNAYSFGYDVSDPATGNTQYRTEERYPNGTVVGAYGYVDPLGTLQRYRYIADQAGYRVMNDIPSYHQPALTAYTTESPKIEALESSITWTRPKRPNKKKGSDNTNIRKKYPINPNYPPSFYVQYE